MNEPTHLDLFSGIGGFSLAAESVGFKTIGFADIAPWACAVIKKRYEGVINYGDIRTLQGVKADLVTGGFPCQPFSQAGLRRGQEDDRFLWPEMLRVIKESGASFVLGENVAGISDMALDQVISDLEGIGYTSRAFDIPACAIDSPQIRRRIWILAYNSKKRWISPSLVSQEEDKLFTSNHKASQVRENGYSTASTISISPSFWEAVHSQSCGNDDGVSIELDRIGCLGNSIVPQIAEIFLKEIIKHI